MARVKDSVGGKGVDFGADAFGECGKIAPGQICSAHTAIKNGIAHKSDAILRNIKHKSTLSVPRRGNHLNSGFAQSEHIALGERSVNFECVGANGKMK